MLRLLLALVIMTISEMSPARAAFTGTNTNVYTSSSKISVTPVVTSASAYSAGFEVGNLMTFPAALRSPGGSGVLETIGVTCKSVQATATFTLYVFSANPSVSNWGDHAARTLAAGDQPANAAILIGHFPLGTGDTNLGMTVYTVPAVGAVIDNTANTIYAVLVATSPVTFTSASDITVTLGFLQD